jgi:HD-GYP domain-containing protein (c-di-GMP phosphodiesterase class II)
MTSKNGSSKERIQKLRLLLDFGKRITSEKNLDSLLELLAREAKEILNADRSSIFILDRKRKILWSKVAQGTKGIIEFPMDKGIAGSAIKSGRLINIKNVYKDARFNPDFDRMTGYKTRSILSAPMRDLHNQVIGVFQVLNKKSKEPFDHEDEEILAIISSQAAVAIENTRLYEQLENAAQDTIFRLAAAAERKDKETGLHLIRMSRYSKIIAEGLGCSREYCEKIGLASPMHDIGKIGVPDAILTKPEKLTDEERKIMENHSAYGSEILKGSDNDLLRMSQNIALTHHERFDGLGYPKQLKGKEIPLEGRIVALADVFDALTSKRSYKEGFSLKKTLELIRNGKGKQFDPEVLNAFETILPRIKQVLEDFNKNGAHKTD